MGPGGQFTRLQIAAGVALSGFWLHELIRVPALLGLTPDGFAIDLMVTVGLVAAIQSRPLIRAWRWALVAWTVITLLAAALTVLPLGWLPFKPEQTPTHYAVHVVFGLCQLPLLAVALWGALVKANGSTKPFAGRSPKC